jgi:type IV pilus assembly protein PilV
MNSVHRKAAGRRIGARPQSGFSLIEVLIAVLVLGVGLLGLALLQSISLRNGNSAAHRTQATNLAYEMIDMIRANRPEAGNYNLIRFTDFAAIDPDNCPAPAGARWQQDRAIWRCAVVRALPGGEGSVEITPPTATVAGQVRVRVRWLDNRGEATAANQRTADNAFEVVSQL